MFSVNQITRIDLELTNACNAKCPQCLRTGDANNGINFKDFLEFNIFKQRFTPTFLGQLNQIVLNGTTGDNAMHPDLLKFTEYIIDNCSNQISLHTNGSMRDLDFWKSLGQQFCRENTSVLFAIDGLKDTHHLYRINTNWDIIIQNAESYISAGGRAVWQMIPFKHNEHQIDQCRSLAKKLNFKEFQLVKNNRFPPGGALPVYVEGKLSHNLEQSSINVDDENNYKIDSATSMQSINFYTKHNINCESKLIKWIGLYADGTIWPCCYLMGFHKMNDRWTKAIQLHFLKHFNLTDLNLINIYYYDIDTILNGKFFKEDLLRSFDTNPNPICISHCSQSR